MAPDPLQQLAANLCERRWGRWPAFRSPQRAQWWVPCPRLVLPHCPRRRPIAAFSFGWGAVRVRSIRGIPNAAVAAQGRGVVLRCGRDGGAGSSRLRASERTAPLLDRCVLLRTVHHAVVDEHAAATNRLHVGRPTTGTTVYPSIGSIVAHEMGPARRRGAGVCRDGLSERQPRSWISGGEGGLHLSHRHVSWPGRIATALRRNRPATARRERLLGGLRDEYAARHPGDKRIAEYAATSADAFKLASGKFASTFDLQTEPAALREAYGSEFGQRCLLARRLTQEGVRFVEVSFNLNFLNGTGWDTHNQGQLNQHLLIGDLDRAFSTLLVDLEKHGRLDKTLVVIATEFGRPPEFDAGGGRGHQAEPSASCWPAAA